MPVALLIISIVFLRCSAAVLDDATLRTVANLSPLAAMALCAGAFFPRKWGLAAPLVAQVASDAIIHFLRPHPFNLGYSLLLLGHCAILLGLGWIVRRHFSVLRLLGASLLGSILFYLISNTASFWYDPAYAKNLAGWAQALTTGVPGYPPTYLFFFKSTGGDLFFTALISLACGAWRPNSRKRAPEEQEEAGEAGEPEAAS